MYLGGREALPWLCLVGGGVQTRHQEGPQGSLCHCLCSSNKPVLLQQQLPPEWGAGRLFFPFLPSPPSLVFQWSASFPFPLLHLCPSPERVCYASRIHQRMSAPVLMSATPCVWEELWQAGKPLLSLGRPSLEHTQSRETSGNYLPNSSRTLLNACQLRCLLWEFITWPNWGEWMVKGTPFTPGGCFNTFQVLLSKHGGN